MEDKAEVVLTSLSNMDEAMLRLSARSAYDQNSELMTPKELLLLVLFGQVETPPDEMQLTESDLKRLGEECLMIEPDFD